MKRAGLLGTAPLAVLLGGAAALAAPEPPQAQRWYVVTAADGAAIGHASQEIVQRDGGQEIVTVQSMSLQERGSPSTIANDRTVVSVDAAGRTTAIDVASQRGRFTTHTFASIGAATAHVVRETRNGRWQGDVPLAADVRFDDGAALLQNWSPAQTPRLEFLNFNIDAMGVDRVVIEAAPGSHADAPFTALRMRYQGDALVGIARLTLDHGEIIDVARPMFGATVHMRPADRATASALHAPYEVLPNTMTRSPFRISSTAAIGHIRYRFSFRDGLAFAFPQTGEQRTGAEGGDVVVDICNRCGPGLRTDAAALADATRSTAWMQSDHPRLRAIAAPIGRLPVTGERKMQMLMTRARPYLSRIDFVGHYSALDTLSRRAGDCTEAAVLLAALGRAAGIPTRVASGLVYSRESYHGVSNAFLPHSWTLAYVDGGWRSFDLALDDFDSTHIALTVGDGDERSIAAAGQLASLLVFDGMTEIRSRPRN